MNFSMQSGGTRLPSVTTLLPVSTVYSVSRQETQEQVTTLIIIIIIITRPGVHKVKPEGWFICRLTKEQC